MRTLQHSKNLRYGNAPRTHNVNMQT